MEIKKENIVAAYKAADGSGKKMLAALFGEEACKDVDNRPVTERIKSFQDAREALGEDHPFCKTWKALSDNDDAELAPDVETYLKLRIIAAALNEGWKPKFTEDEERYYPWFWLYTEDDLSNKDDEWMEEHALMGTGIYETEYVGFAYLRSHLAPSGSYANFASRLCFKNRDIATYCGKQFIGLWADYLLIRK